MVEETKTKPTDELEVLTKLQSGAVLHTLKDVRIYMTHDDLEKGQSWDDTNM